MATSPYGGFADLSRYVAAANQPSASPLDSLIQGVQQGSALRNLPQTLQQDALNQQIAQALQMAKLQQLQQPEIFNAGGNLFIRDPSSSNGVRSIFTPTTKAEQPFYDAGSGLGIRPTGNPNRPFEAFKIPIEGGNTLQGTIAERAAADLAGAQLKFDQSQKTEQDRRDFQASQDSIYKLTADEQKNLSDIKNQKTVKTMQGYDTKNGKFGIFTPDENGNFPEGVVPSSQAPKPDSTTPVNKEFQVDALNRSIEAIDSLISRTNDSTTGRAARLQGSSAYPSVLQSDAYVNYGADLDSVKSGIFLTQIAAMKASSKSGSAGLGAISNKEGDRLESAYASLRQNQSADNIKKNLGIAKDAIQKYRDALNKYGNDKSTPSQNAPSFNTEAEAAAANLQNGTPVIINGVKGTWQH